jgi:hypothetical protein
MGFWTAEQIARFAAGTVRLDLMVEFQFATGTKRVWNGNTPLVSNGFTWQPMYGAGGIDGLSMPIGTAAESVTFQMNGLPGKADSLLAAALAGTDEVLQRLAIIHLQLFGEDWQPEGPPVGIWWGFMQPPRVSRTPMQGAVGGTQLVTMAAENAFFNRSRPPYGRYTDRDQQARSPGDKFFQMTPALLFKIFDYPIF